MQAFSWSKIDYPIVICPPMDGITDMAYRELVAQMGGSGAQYCEFVNVKGIMYESVKTFFELRFTEIQRPIIAQLFGSEPEDFYEAVKKTVPLGFDAIDINMGCPAHKVASKGSGCALMDDPKTAASIVRNTIKGANEIWKEMGNDGEYEVTTKMRLGVSDKNTVFTHGMAMLEAGSKAVAIHGRTLKQMYTGEADWEPIKEFKSRIGASAKVFGSGDVKSLYEAFVRLVTCGVDGVMIGRGSFGNPWVFEKRRVDRLKELCIQYGWPQTIPSIEEIPASELEDIKRELDNQTHSFEEVREMAIRHARLMVQDKGPHGIVQMRKHLGWYFGGFNGAKSLRSQLVRVESIDELEAILNSFTIEETIAS